MKKKEIKENLNWLAEQYVPADNPENINDDIYRDLKNNYNKFYNDCYWHGLYSHLEHNKEDYNIKEENLEDVADEFIDEFVKIVETKLKNYITKKAKKIIEKEKKEMEDRVEGWIDFLYESSSNYFCQQEFLDMAIDGYWTYLCDEYGEEIVEEIWDELSDYFKIVLEKQLIEEAIKEVESILEDYKTVAFVLGIQHIHTPYKYYPSYKILSENLLDKEGVQSVLEKNDISPHAWGVMADTDNWGNYWWLILTHENYKEEIKDIEYALAILANGYEIIEDSNEK